MARLVTGGGETRNAVSEGLVITGTISFPTLSVRSGSSCVRTTTSGIAGAYVYTVFSGVLDRTYYGRVAVRFNDSIVNNSTIMRFDTSAGVAGTCVVQATTSGQLRLLCNGVVIATWSKTFQSGASAPWYLIELAERVSATQGSRLVGFRVNEEEVYALQNNANLVDSAAKGRFFFGLAASGGNTADWDDWGLNDSVSGPNSFGYSGTNYDALGADSIFGDAAASTSRAQRIAIAHDSLAIDNANIMVTKIGSPTDQLVADVYADDDGQIGALLDTSTAVSGSTRPTAEGTSTTFTFPNRMPVDKGHVWVVLRRTGAVDNANHYRWSTWRFTGAQTAAVNNGSSWTYNSTGYRHSIQFNVDVMAGWTGDGRVVHLLPVADSGALSGDIGADAWRAGNTGTTNLFEAVNNVPPAGLASPGTTTSQIVCDSPSVSRSYRPMTEPYDARVPSGLPITFVRTVVVHGESIATGTKTGGMNVSSNPDITSVSVTYGEDVGACGTFPTNWKVTFGVVSYNPTLIRSEGAQLSINEATNARNADVCYLAMQVEYKEYVPPPRSRRKRHQAVMRAATW